MIILIDAKKTLDKFHTIHDKDSKKMGIEGNFLSLIKIIHKKSIANIIMVWHLKLSC